MMYHKVIASIFASLLIHLHPADGSTSNKSIDQRLAAMHAEKKDIVVYIDKSEHKLSLKVGEVTLKEYSCVFGGDPVSDKKYQGDGCTPEGIFHIRNKYPHRLWSKFMWIDYPNAESWRKYETNKKQHRIPPNAGIGGDIGIHGVPDSKDYYIDQNINWTLGCISLRNEDVNEIYQYIDIGTEVIITK